MVYVIWAVIGIAVAMFVGAGPRRRAYRPNANSAMLAGAFGALIGGFIGDGLPHTLGGQFSLTSVIGAVLGSLLFCWAVRERAEDVEP